MFDWFPTTSFLKNTAPANVFEYCCICFMIACDTDFGCILETKIDPKSVPTRLRNVSNFIVALNAFEGHPGPPKINFWANMAPTWPPLGLKIDPKWNPNWCPNRSQNESGEPKWVDVWSIVIEVLLIFDQFWFHFHRFSSFSMNHWEAGSSRFTPLNTALTTFEARG